MASARGILNIQSLKNELTSRTTEKETCPRSIIRRRRRPDADRYVRETYNRIKLLARDVQSAVH